MHVCFDKEGRRHFWNKNAIGNFRQNYMDITIYLTQVDLFFSECNSLHGGK